MDSSLPNEIWNAAFQYGRIHMGWQHECETDEENTRVCEGLSSAVRAYADAARAEGARAALAGVPNEVRVLVETAMTLVPTGSLIYQVGRMWLSTLTPPAAPTTEAEC